MDSLHDDKGLIQSDMEIGFLEQYEMDDLERQLLYFSLKDSESRYELLWSGPLTIISELRRTIQIVLLARLVHLMLDLVHLSKLKDLASCLLGLYLLRTFLDRAAQDSHKAFLLAFALTVILFYISSYFVLGAFIARHHHCDKNQKIESELYIGSALIVIAPIVMNECLIYYQNRVYLTVLRSIFMTIAMKTFSQLVDSRKNFKNNTTNRRGPLQVIAYFLHPASCLFGPWHEYSATQRATELINSRSIVSEFIGQSTSALKALALTSMLLMASVSLIDLVQAFMAIELHRSCPALARMASIYFAAQNFRLSHYFMCHLSNSFLAFWSDPKPSANKNRQICSIAKVEWPRSLVQVVIYWNVPMSNWLRDYVFLPLKGHTSNSTLAVIVTYLISSLFHGFKFNIWSVLLSLGAYTLIEFELRRRLALRLCACVLAKACPLADDGRKCTNGHTRTENNSIMVRLVNFSFRALAIIHLTYLGYIFKGNTDQTSYREDIRAWSELYFFSPLLAVLTFLLSVTLV